MTEHVGTCVVGAGIAGIGLALRLAEEGVDDVLVLERSDGVGGTWHDNVYPGVACDIPAHLYSFSFAPNPGWSRRYAPGAEIRAYLETCADPVIDRIRLGTAVLEASWDGAVWRITTTRGEVTADALVLAVGRLAEPRIPAIPGLEAFPGPVLHTARWDTSLDVAGRHVAVVGTGASAVQLVPRLAAAGARVTLLQRSAPWIVPREDHPYDADERDRFARDDDARRAHREAIFAGLERAFAARRLRSPEQAALRARALAHLHRAVPPGPLRDALTPSIEVGCRRVALSDDFYPALASGAVHLEPSALVALEGRTAVASSGRTTGDVEVVVLATGFEAQRPPIAASVRGTAGSLADAWRDGMRAYASVAVPGFPNLFVLDGPNAALSHNSAVHVIESQLEHVCGALERIRGGAVLDAAPEAASAAAAEIDRRTTGMVWGTCESWYRDPGTGRLTVLWPGTAEDFRQVNGTFDPGAYRVARSALAS